MDVKGPVAGSDAGIGHFPGANAGQRREKRCDGAKDRGPQSPLYKLCMMYPIHYSRRFSKSAGYKCFTSDSPEKKERVYSTLMKFFPASPQIGHFSGAFPISMFPHQGQRKTSAPSKSFPARTVARAFL